MKVVGIGRPVYNEARKSRRVSIYLEDPSTPVTAGSAYQEMVVFASANDSRLFEDAMTLTVGDEVIPYRNSNGYLQDIVRLR